MFELFSEGARKMMDRARAVALRTKSGYIDSSHIVLGVLGDDSSGAVRLLVHLGVNVPKLRAGVEQIATRGSDPSEPWQVPFSPDAKALIENAAGAAAELNHSDIATGHFLVADLGNPAGVLRQVLPGLGMEPLLLRSRILDVLSKVDFL